MGEQALEDKAGKAVQPVGVAGNAADAPRHVYGPRPVGVLVPGITRAAFKKRSPAGAQMLADWAAIAGPDLAAAAIPRRFAGGTLTLACNGPKATELQHQSSQIIERVNSHLGRILVERLRFVQDPGVMPSSAHPSTPPALPRRPAAAVPLPGIAPGPLHDALAALGEVVAGQGRGRA